MTKPAQHFYGSVPRTALATTINPSDTTIQMADATGWPTVGPFIITLERGTAKEEKVKIASRSGVNLTVAASGRGYDASTAVSHTASASCYIEHSLDAAWCDAMDAIMARLTTKGDMLVSTGAAYARLPAGTDALPLVADSTQANGVKYASLTSTGITDGAVTTAKLGAGAVTAAKITAGTITATELASNAVTTVKLIDDAVTSPKIADGAIDTRAYFGTGIAPIQSRTSDPSSGMLEGELIARTDLDYFKIATSPTAVIPRGVWGNWATGGRPGCELAQITGMSYGSGATILMQCETENWDTFGMSVGGGATAFATIPTGMSGYWELYHDFYLNNVATAGEVMWVTSPASSPGILFSDGIKGVIPITAGIYHMFNNKMNFYIAAGTILGLQIQITAAAPRTIKGTWGMIWLGP